jgi:hypothetical protein
LQDLGIDIQRRGLALSERQFGISMDRQESGIQYNQDMLRLNRSQQLMTRQFSKEDWTMQDQVRGLQWQWKSEDFDESVRFMTGRQRKLAERQQGRDTVMHNIEGDNISKQRSRQKQLWKLEDNRFRLQEQRQQEEIEHQEELIEIQKEQFELRKEQFALTEENLGLSKEQFEIQKEQYELQGENLALQQENMEKNLAFQEERMALEEQSMELQRAYQVVQHQLQGAAIGAAVEQAEKAKAIAEDTVLAQTTQKDILSAWGTWQETWPVEFQDAFSIAIDAVAGKFASAMSSVVSSLGSVNLSNPYGSWGNGGSSTQNTSGFGGNLSNMLGNKGAGYKAGSGDALGGHRFAGEPGEVGEYEPELFIPEQSGTIIPMHKINPWVNRRIESPAMAKNKSKSGPTVVKVYIGNEQIDNHVIRVVESELEVV